VTVKVGFCLPGELYGRPPAELRAALDRVEAAGIDHLGTADHVSFHTGWGVDALINATLYLALNERLPVYIGVYLLALRNPVTVARQLASIAEFAPGRLTLGVGTGGEDRHEVEVCGIDPRTRGRRTDDCIQVLRGLAGGEKFSFAGSFYQLADAQIIPAPRPPVPIIVGGRDPRALARAGRLGDGWLGIWATPAKFRERLAAVRAAAAEAGRAADCIDHGLQLWCGVGRDAESARPHVAEAMERMYRIPFARFEQFSPSGTPAEIAAYLAPFVEAGCTTFNIAARAGSFEESVEALGEVRRLLNA
jgi:alkanesulfonate monooxygenase SsuD/methylene tetrahydromethanopterin reductase-like flavin-dependent oxidoreductase (luciferase family)